MSLSLEKLSVKEALAIFALSIPLSIYRAFIFSQLWKWFVVSSFNLSPVSIPASMGLILIFSLLDSKASLSREINSFVEALGWMLGGSLVFPSVCLFIGWIINLFM